jgi:hypothetical protein
MHSDGYDVHVSFKYIRYSEGERHLGFDREPSGDAATPAIVWFPSPKRWRETIPDWAHPPDDAKTAAITATLTGGQPNTTSSQGSVLVTVTP